MITPNETPTANQPPYKGDESTPTDPPAERPEDILKKRTLSEDEKARELEEMRVDQELLQVADDEGMQGGTPPDLQRVRKAERTLGEAEAEAEDCAVNQDKEDRRPGRSSGRSRGPK